MTEPIYKIGDVLSYSDTASTYLILAVKDVYLLNGTEYQYKCLKTRGCYCDEAQITWVSEFFFVKACNRVGHIDISWLTGKPDAKPTSGRYKWGEYGSFNDRKEQEKKKWNVTDEDWPEIKKSLEDTGMIVEEIEKDDTGIRATCKIAKNDICDEYDALEAKVKDLTEKLKFANEAYNRQTICHEAWKQGWNECLKTFKYYLGTDEENED